MIDGIPGKMIFSALEGGYINNRKERIVIVHPASFKQKTIQWYYRDSFSFNFGDAIPMTQQAIRESTIDQIKSECQARIEEITGDCVKRLEAISRKHKKQIVNLTKEKLLLQVKLKQYEECNKRDNLAGRKKMKKNKTIAENLKGVQTLLDNIIEMVEGGDDPIGVASSSNAVINCVFKTNRTERKSVITSPTA